MIKAKGCCCCCWAGWRAGGRQSSSIRKTLQWSCGRRLNKEILCGGRSVRCCSTRRRQRRQPPKDAPALARSLTRSQCGSSCGYATRHTLRRAGGRPSLALRPFIQYTLSAPAAAAAAHTHCCMHPFRHATRPPPFIFNRLAATRPAVLAH